MTRITHEQANEARELLAAFDKQAEADRQEALRSDRETLAANAARIEEFKTTHEALIREAVVAVRAARDEQSENTALKKLAATISEAKRVAEGLEVIEKDHVRGAIKRHAVRVVYDGSGPSAVVKIKDAVAAAWKINQFDFDEGAGQRATFHSRTVVHPCRAAWFKAVDDGSVKSLKLAVDLTSDYAAMFTCANGRQGYLRDQGGSRGTIAAFEGRAQAALEAAS